HSMRARGTLCVAISFGAQACLSLEPIPDIRHGLNVIAIKSKLSAERVNVTAERFGGHAMASGANCIRDSLARQGLIRSRRQEPQDSILDEGQAKRSAAAFGRVRPR